MLRIVVSSGLAAVLALDGMQAASAADAPAAVHIARAIPYQSDDVGSPNVRQCNWTQQLSQYIVKKSQGRVVATDGDLASLPGRTLHIVVTRAHTAGGGSISGPKWGRIDGQLKEDGVLIGNFSIKRATARPFTLSVCGPLTKVADALAGDVNEWLKHPTIDPDAGKPAVEEVE